MSFVQQSCGKLSRLALLVIFSFCVYSGHAATKASAEDDLTIGSKAPALDIAHWLSNRDGEFSKVTEFEEDKVYVVEFWATWCGPCISAMPHIFKMQDEYADKGVQFISVSREELPTIIKFLMKNVRGKKDQNYAQLTSAYSLTSDPDASVHTDYMKASGQRGIPTAFIVGKTGLIEWIGHPMSMDKPLGEIVGDDWDRENFAVNYKQKKKLETVMGKVSRLVRKDDSEGAMKELNTFLETAKKGSSAHDQASMVRLGLLKETDDEEGYAKAFKELAGSSKNHGLINQLTWGIVENVQGGKDVDSEILEAACHAAKRGVALAKEEKNDQTTSMIMDTHANLLFLCDKLDEAIAVQEEAVELSDDEQLVKFLEKLKAAKKKKDA